MNNTNWLKRIFGIKTFSPLGFLSWALLLTLFHVVCHAYGLREHTTFISGTAASEGVESSAVRGLVYMISYFGFALAAPILVIASGIFAGLKAMTKCTPALSPADSRDEPKT
jgi:hypothetical protein